MKTMMRRFLILVLLVSTFNAYSQGFLRADGKKIRDGHGNELILRGMGLGGWMLQEPYMLQLSGAAANQQQIREKLEKLTGKENIERFYDAWLTNFCTKADIDSMAAWGFNSVRLPMHYNLYTLPVDKEKDSAKNTWLTKGFALTDSLLKWCKANKIYLILDLHAAPGGQGNDIPIADRDDKKPSLWQSAANRKKTIKLWSKLAKRYANEEWIGGYDLINETNWNFTNPEDKNGCNEKQNVELKSLLAAITKAIRTVDKKHMIFIEGNCWANNYNGMFPLWDKNIVVSFHKYWNNNDMAGIESFLKIRDEQNVPLWVGESGENSNTWFTDAISLLEENKIGWAWWPLKKMGSNNPLQIKKPARYQELIKQLRDGKNEMTKDQAIALLTELANATRIENNIFHPDIVDAMFRQVRVSETVPFQANRVDNKLLLYASDYDRGRSGYSYYDRDSGNYWVSTKQRTAGNRGGQYRNDGVDIGICDDTLTNGYSIGWTEEGEWLQYTLDVLHKGWYNMKIRAKSINAQSGSLALFVNDKKAGDDVVLDNHVQNKWNTTGLNNVWLNEGKNRLRLMIVKGGIDLNYLELQNSTSTTTSSFSISNKTATVYTTAEKTNLRLTSTATLDFTDFAQPLETQPCVFVDPSLQFQTFIGIGGALTDASAETFAKLPKDKQDEFLKAYYDPVKGIGYTLARTNIASCDFSSRSYTYVQENDRSLSSFTIEHDKKYRIPFIKAVMSAAGNNLTLYASPWSPPAWMKTNKDLLHGGKLLPEFMEAWANHYVKFIQAYEKEGMPIWGLSVQNEPMATQKWESCIFTAEDERDFIKKYLGPALEKAGYGNKKLIAWDHNRDLIYQRANTILEDPDAAKYVWGIGFHWYETWTGSGMQFDNVKAVNQKFSSKNLIFTEGCVEAFTFDRINDWSLGERYGWSMINDFNSGTVGWTDWNVLLDEKGGPNHAGNFCFAPVIADTRDGTLHYTNSYYYIGHFSKFIQSQAKRVAALTTRDKLSATAFLNKDGSVSVIVMNRSDDKLNYHLSIGEKAAAIESLPHSISTIVVK